jgi:Zn finger protein HypA/HybF involved in hydrogenase expression
MTYSKELLTNAHKHCRNNRKDIAVSAECGCFYCRQVYPAVEVTKYTNLVDAICPKCGIDSVLADGSGLEVSVPFLSAMSDRWFGDAEGEIATK